MSTSLIVIFVLAYVAIALEEPLKVNKSAVALIGAGLLWTVYSIFVDDHLLLDKQLSESLVGTAQIAFFLMGAMTIVEVIDAHDGFDVITSRIRAKSLATLVWIVGLVSFLLSAVLDNLTTAIVIVSLLRRLLANREDRLIFAGLAVISANAGGAWSPIGDVTTTMLWIGGQVTTENIVTSLLLPSLANMIAPLVVLSLAMRGKPVPALSAKTAEKGSTSSVLERNLMFFLGLSILMSVPVFKAVTRLPPFLGILFGLGILWAVGDLLHRGKPPPVRVRMAIAHALTRIDMSAVIFFVGILLSVATLEHAQILSALAGKLDQVIGRQGLIVMVIGLVSAVVDNVPLVAASIGMYSLEQYPPDSFLWEFMAYCGGTGGSILIIGSAAGVAAMGMERINFLWYMRKFTPLALIGYVAGALVYVLQFSITH